MAPEPSKFNFLKNMDARARVFVLVGIVLLIGVLIYLGSRYFGTASSAIGPSQVANAPSTLKSVPGGELSPEYSKAIQQANIQNAQQAQMSGSSAVPTLVNIGSQPTMQGNQANCNIICSDQSANVKSSLEEWVKQGKLTPETANELEQLADKNVTPEEYADRLNQLVKEGKLTPEQARELLETYKKQHDNAMLQDSAKTMDDLIKSGQLPLEVANQLLKAQKDKVSPAEYAAQLQQLVKEGKISPEVAKQLLAQYTQQQAKESTKEGLAMLDKMASNGQITPDVKKTLQDLESRNVGVDELARNLQKLVAEGKLTPEAAAKILDEYKKQKAALGPAATLTRMVEKAEAAAYGEINDLVKAGKMPQDVGTTLTNMIQSNVPMDQFNAALTQFVQQHKITPEIAKLKNTDYVNVQNARITLARLGQLQANNASPQAYAEELKKMVAEGIITPDQAAELLQQYQAATSTGSAALGGGLVGPGTADFNRLQQAVQNSGGQVAALPAAQFTAAELAAQQKAAQDQQKRIDDIMSAMNGQAQQLVAAWQPPVMLHKDGVPPVSATTGKPGAGGSGTANNGSNSPTATVPSPVLIKSGTIVFAVLDTAVNSDYPDSPVMATVVEGPYKGSKLLGKLVTSKGVSGQLDRVSLNFIMMNKEDWQKSKAVTAYGIDPDTARTVLASSVDYHYLQRFGAMMATSFLQGYASAITNAGTATTGIFGTSTTHPDLSPSQKIATALGQMGQTLGAATQNYINIPPTVKVDSGVGLGILFMADVT